MADVCYAIISQRFLQGSSAQSCRLSKRERKISLTSGMKHLDKLAIIVKLEHVSNSYMLKRNIMFEENGILYADSSKELLKIQDAKPLDDMMMLLTFSTGEQRLFDATILNGPAFAPLSDEKIFKDCKVVDWYCYMDG